MMYALVAPVLVFGGGAAIDYGRAAQIHTKLNAGADAAALAALTPAMLQQTATPLTANYINGWTTDSANFGVMEMYSNNDDCANSACSSSTSSPGGDVATNFDNALGDLSQAAYIPNPGNGTNQSG